MIISANYIPKKQYTHSFQMYMEHSLILTTSVQFSHSVMPNFLQPHGLQNARPPCPPTPGVCSNSCPSSQWCYPTISSSVVSSSHLQSFPASGSFPMSQFFASGGQSIGVSASASVLPMNIQDWYPFKSVGWISLQRSEILPSWDSEGHGSMVCCSPWGHKRLDMTQWLSNNIDFDGFVFTAISFKVFLNFLFNFIMG